MAVLTTAQLTRLRQQLARALPESAEVIDYNKLTVNAALQAIEDWMVGGFGARPAHSLSAAIDAAISPSAFTATQKRLAVAVWADARARAEGIS